jgi:hypothetical protein
VGLNRRHRAVTLTDRDGRINCPGGGAIHPLKTSGRLFAEGHALFYCETCQQWIFLLWSKHGVIDTWEIHEHEVAAMEREGMTEARRILEFLNRGSTRLD